MGYKTVFPLPPGGCYTSGSEGHSGTLACLWDGPRPGWCVCNHSSSQSELPSVPLFLDQTTVLLTKGSSVSGRTALLPVQHPGATSQPAAYLSSRHAAVGFWPEDFLSLGGRV